MDALNTLPGRICINGIYYVLSIYKVKTMWYLEYSRLFYNIDETKKIFSCHNSSIINLGKEAQEWIEKINLVNSPNPTEDKKQQTCRCGHAYYVHFKGGWCHSRSTHTTKPCDCVKYEPQ